MVQHFYFQLVLYRMLSLRSCIESTPGTSISTLVAVWIISSAMSELGIFTPWKMTRVTLFVLAVPTFHFRAVFLDPVPRDRHRIIVNLIDKHFDPGLTDDERLLAARDIVFEAPRGLSPHRSTFV